MVRLDLVPDEFKVRQVRQRRLRIWLIIVLATCGAGLIWSGLKYIFYRQEDTASQYLAHQYQSIQQKIQSLTAEKNQLTKYQGRIALLNELARYPDLTAVIEYLTQNTAPTVYMQEITFTHDKQEDASAARHVPALIRKHGMFNIKKSQATAAQKSAAPPSGPVTIILKGYAVNHQAVAQFLNMLNQAGMFVGIELRQTRRESGKTFDSVDFEIEGAVLPPRSRTKVNYADMSKTKNL